MSFVRRFYPKRLTYIQYCGQSPQEQFGVKCLAQGHNDMLTAVGLELAIPWFEVQHTTTEPHSPSPQSLLCSPGKKSHSSNHWNTFFKYSIYGGLISDFLLIFYSLVQMSPHCLSNALLNPNNDVMFAILLQVQATVVGFLAAVAAICLGSFSRGGIELDQAAVLCASSIITAFVAALSLGE